MKRPFQFRCHFDGTVLIPDARTLDYCKHEVGAGELITLERNEEISPQSRGHYFAALHEAWNQLPEREAARFPTVEHLRSYALIQAGYCDERTITCATRQEAATIAAFVKPLNHFAVVDVRGTVVRVFTAKSQSARAMSKKDFIASKQAVLEIVTAMVGVSIDELSKNAGKAA